MQYGKVTPEIISQLREIVGEKNIMTEGMENYARDEAPFPPIHLPDVVVKPEDTASVARILKLANERLIPVTPRGGGTGLSGGAIAVYGGILLSLEKMKRIQEIDEANFTATVEPGVTLAEFYKALGEHGLYYPVYPGELTATIGGTIATNAGGMRAVKYGVTRQSVLGLEAVLPGGEVIQTGGKFVKCSTGYDLTQLIVGSEGTLAVVTGVTLKVAAAPKKTELLFIPFNSLHDAIRCVPDILKAGIQPIGIEFMQKDVIQAMEGYLNKELPLHDYEAFLMIFVEAENDEEFFRSAESIDEVCRKRNAVDVYIPNTDEAKRTLLEAREKFYFAVQALGMSDIADVVVPRSRIADFVEEVQKISARHNVSIVNFGHAGDGNVHIQPVSKGGYDASLRKAVLTDIYKVGISMGGTISGEHGLGVVKKDFLLLAADNTKIELMRRIKHAFDPNHIMNPGKVLDF
jgi:glycolate oxidase